MRGAVQYLAEALAIIIKESSSMLSIQKIDVFRKLKTSLFSFLLSRDVSLSCKGCCYAH